MHHKCDERWEEIEIDGLRAEREGPNCTSYGGEEGDERRRGDGVAVLSYTGHERHFAPVFECQEKGAVSTSVPMRQSVNINR